MKISRGGTSGKKMTTSNLRGHIKVSVSNSVTVILDQKHRSKLEETINKHRKWTSSEQRAQKKTMLIGEMICVDIQPYSLVTDQGFKKLIMHIEPRINSEFNSMTAVLQLKKITGSHTGVKISKFLKDSLNEWKIPTSKVYFVLSDNAANMKLAIKEAGLEKNYLSCVIHTLQLCVTDKLFKQHTVVNDLTAKSRKIVTHFHHSPSSMDMQHEMQQQLKLPQHSLIQDVATL
ncbi:zinc finger BED domain-containing protein 4-like [Hydra vulgaris]|uniref:zinc finger BED domain-containing protein 4-like n=1 Tax=Hydra vulgaris TaxID=6087 RepID=UPI001F5EB1AB|nr:zinc finger BED domain-containing protein 4-like [Hydra vulgaris]